jgi:hypothetical protein
MATYGNRFIFEFFAQNGDDVDIFISKKNYSGQSVYRPVGRPPILKRERNGCILGTSLEIYAESRVDGEYAELYTSSADEYKVTVYKNRILQWVGFVSPELYSEPDIAPPYDVQIIATDGLGELKNTYFEQSAMMISLREHLTYILSKTALTLDLDFVSSLQWDDEAQSNPPDLLLDLKVNLKPYKGLYDYEVLQKILMSLGACITQQNGKWVIIRESDIYANLGKLPSASFGSANKADWWPIGNMSTDVIPAKKMITLIQKNSYVDSLIAPMWTGIAGGWNLTNVHYDEDDGAFIIPTNGKAEVKIEFPLYPLDKALKFRIKARQKGDSGNAPDEPGDGAPFFVQIKAAARFKGINTDLWLTYEWSSTQYKYVQKWVDSSWQYELDVPKSETVENVLVLPAVSGLEIDSITILIQPYLTKGLAVYDVLLQADNQIPGLSLVAKVSNNAREEYDAEVSMSSSADPLSADFMYGVLRLDGGITRWHTPYNSAPDLLRFIAKDYAMQMALPRMRYRGKLNVPAMGTPVVPMLFIRDNTYYFLNTYSYDLLNDELEVELISIPNASVQIESETVTELEPGTGGGSSSGSGGGSSGGGSTTGGSNSLSGLIDVNLQNLQDGQVLAYDQRNNVWRNIAALAGGSAALENEVNADVAVGFISKNTSLYEGMTFTDFVEMMFSQGVKVYKPSVTLSGVPSQPIEVGSEVTLNVTSSFKDGYFAGTDEGTTKAGCQPENASFSLDNNAVTMPHTFTAEAPMIHTIQVAQPYGASTVTPIKGGSELEDSIPAGTASAESTFVVGYRAFWGYMTDDEAESIDSAAIRGLEHIDAIINPTQNVITLLNTKYEIPGGQDIIIAVPEGYALGEVKDEDGDFAKAFKALDDVVVKCAGTATKTYKVYRFDNGTPYPMEILSITIKKA